MSGNGKIDIQGRLTIETVPALFKNGMQQLETGDLQVDLSRVEAVDSAAISLLLSWQRAAQRSKRRLQIDGCPEDLITLARLYGVEDLLTLHG